MGNIGLDLFTLPTYIGRFSRSDREEFLFNWGGDWWLINYDGGKIQTRIVSDTRGFGDISRNPTYLGDFDGDSKKDVLFYYPGDDNWWLGRFPAR